MIELFINTRNVQAESVSRSSCFSHGGVTPEKEWRRYPKRSTYKCVYSSGVINVVAQQQGSVRSQMETDLCSGQTSSLKFSCMRIHIPARWPKKNSFYIMLVCNKICNKQKTETVPKKWHYTHFLPVKWTWLVGIVVLHHMDERISRFMYKSNKIWLNIRIKWEGTQTETGAWGSEG